MGTGYFPGVKRPGLGVYHTPHLAQRLKNEYSYTSNPLSAFVTCFRVNFTFSDSLVTEQHKQQPILATHVPKTLQIFFRFRPLHLPSRLF